jgi:NAD+ kinase
VALVVHEQRPEAAELARAAVRWLRDRHHDVRLPKADAGTVGLPELGCGPEELADGADLAVTLGGDGTILRAVSLLSRRGVPLLGVNLGRLGYLADLEPEGLIEALERVLSGDYVIEERMMLSVAVQRAGEPLGPIVLGGDMWALNEAVVERPAAGHTVHVAVQVEGRFWTTYAADGLIVATPTGSTAYAFSAGGPVVWPDVEALLVVPTNAHALFARPLVTSPNSVLTVAVPPDGTRARVSADGRRIVEVPDGGRVEVRRSDRPVRIARVNPTSFGDRLVAKFGLPVRGFRDARSHGPGHEAPTWTSNVLARGINTADGTSSTGEEVGGGHPDSEV